MRFFVSGASGALSAGRASTWLGDAWQHLTAPESGPRGLPPQPASCPYLLMEDFGTKGLEGDPAAEDLQPGEEKNHFYAFFRAEGVSESTGGRGTWGVGKTVFARSSRINTFFGLTVRRQDVLPLLMGQAILRFHRLGETKFAPDGMFGVIQPDSQFVCPVENLGRIEEFRRDFRVSRQDEAGLSVIVPYCLEEITEDTIVQAVGREYFSPILTGGAMLGGHSRALNRGVDDSWCSAGSSGACVARPPPPAARAWRHYVTQRKYSPGDRRPQRGRVHIASGAAAVFPRSQAARHGVSPSDYPRGAGRKRRRAVLRQT